MLDKLLKLCRRSLSVEAYGASEACRGGVELRARASLEADMAPAASGVLYFADNHKAMLEEIGVKAVAKPGLFGRMFGRK